MSIDDHPLLRDGISALIGGQPDMLLVGQAVDGQDGITQYRQLRPDITLMDIRLPDMSGIDVAIAIRSQFVNARIIMLSNVQGDFEIQRALAVGARGIVLKSMNPGELITTIRQVHAGKRWVPAVVSAHLAEYLEEDNLTRREVEILRLIARGKSNRNVGAELSITEDTVKVHVKHVMEKLGASDRTDAVVIAIRRGIIEL